MNIRKLVQRKEKEKKTYLGLEMHTSRAPSLVVIVVMVGGRVLMRQDGGGGGCGPRGHGRRI